MKIALTGHQPSRLRGQEELIIEWIFELFLFLICMQDKLEILCGGAEGADRLWAEFYDLNCNKNRAILRIYEGYKGQCKYRQMADELWWATEKGVPLDNYNFVKDCRMIDDCDILLAVWDGVEEGGTWEAIQYARKKDKPIIYCPPSIMLRQDEDE